MIVDYFIETPQGLCPLHRRSRGIFEIPKGFLDSSWKKMEQMLSFDCNLLELSTCTHTGSFFGLYTESCDEDDAWVSLYSTSPEDKENPWRGMYKLVKEGK